MDEEGLVKGIDPVEKDKLGSSDGSGNGRCSSKSRIYMSLTDIKSSRTARWIGHYLDILVMISCALLCFESVPAWSQSKVQRIVWFSIESFIALHFAVDFLVKLVMAPDKHAYLISWNPLVDILSILPWITEVVYFFRPHHSGKWGWTSLRILRLLRFIRFLRITLHSVPEMRLFGKAVKKSRLALLFLFCYLFGAGLFFSCCYYVAETSICRLDTNSLKWVLSDDGKTLCNVQNMFDSMWLVIITMFTVGYGDVSPKSIIGKLIVAVMIVSSMIFLTLPISIFGANLTELYLENRLAKRLFRSHKLINRTPMAVAKDDTSANIKSALMAIEASMSEMSKDIDMLRRRLEMTARQRDQLQKLVSGCKL